MKEKITLVSLICLLLAACSTSEQSPGNEYSQYSLGKFPASRDEAKPVPVTEGNEIIITKSVSVDVKENEQVIITPTTQPYRTGLQAVATPVFNKDGHAKMILQGTYNCEPSEYPAQSEMPVHLTRSYNFLLEVKARPGDRLVVRTKACQASVPQEELPVVLKNIS